MKNSCHFPPIMTLFQSCPADDCTLLGDRLNALGWDNKFTDCLVMSACPTNFQSKLHEAWCPSLSHRPSLWHVRDLNFIQ